MTTNKELMAVLIPLGSHIYAASAAVFDATPLVVDKEAGVLWGELCDDVDRLRRDFGLFVEYLLQDDVGSDGDSAQEELLRFVSSVGTDASLALVGESMRRHLGVVKTEGSDDN
jgi:hypothetical protein